MKDTLTDGRLAESWGFGAGAAEWPICTSLDLYALQHRGQEEFGIVFDGEDAALQGVGLVPDVFDEDNLAELEGLQGLAMCA